MSIPPSPNNISKFIANFARRRLIWTASQFKKPNQNIVINGFWRSGTTWLQEAICGITGRQGIFEPFEGSNNHMDRYYRLVGIDDWPLSIKNAILPYASELRDDNGELYDIVDNSMRGNLPDSFNLMRIQSNFWGRVFDPGMVIKFTRGAFILKALIEKYNCTSFHIYRDPRSVITSIYYIKDGWGRGAFSDLDLDKLLLHDFDDRRQALEPELCILNSLKINYLKDPVSKIAIYYAITEHYIRRMCIENTLNINLIPYEKITLSKDTFIDKILRPIKIDPIKQDLDRFFFRRSGSSFGETSNLTSDRLFRWKKYLSRKKCDEIYNIMDSFDLTDRFYTG